MKTKLFYLLTFSLVSFSNHVFSQDWTYFKDFPKSISFYNADHDNFGRNFALSSEYQIWMKSASNIWVKFGDYPVANFRDLMVNKSTGTVYLADEANGLVFTNNNGQTWQEAWLQNNPTSGLKESLNTLSNINNSNSFYSGGTSAFSPFSPRLFRYQISGNTVSSIQEVAFDVTNNANSVPLAIHQSTSGSTVIVGTFSNGFFTSTNGGLTFTNHLPNLQVYSICQAINGFYYALVIDQTNGQNVLMKSNDGQVWSSFATPVEENERFTTLYFDNSLNELWVGSTNALYKVQDLNLSTANLINQSYNNSTAYVSGITKTDNKVNLFTLQYTFQTLTNSNWEQNLNGFKGISKQLIFNTSNELFSVDYTTPILAKSSLNSSQWLNTIVTNSSVGGLDALKADGLGNVFSKRINRIFKVSSSGIVTAIDAPITNLGFISNYFVADNGSIYLIHSTNPAALYYSSDDGLSWNIIQQLPTNDSFLSVVVDLNQTIYYTTATNLSSFHYKTLSSSDWIQVEFDTSAEPSGCFTQCNVERTKDKIFFRVCNKVFLIENFAISSQIQTPVGDDPSNIGVLIQTDNGLYTTAFEGTLTKVFKSSDNGISWNSMGCPEQLFNYPNSVYSILADSFNTIYVQTNPFIDLPVTVSGIYKLTESLNSADFDFEPDVIIYPNPANEILNIKTTNDLESLVIYDVSGRKVYSIAGASNTLDVAKLSSGTYFLKIDEKGGYTKTLKFIKD